MLCFPIWKRWRWQRQRRHHFSFNKPTLPRAQRINKEILPFFTLFFFLPLLLIFNVWQRLSGVGSGYRRNGGIFVVAHICTQLWCCFSYAPPATTTLATDVITINLIVWGGGALEQGLSHSHNDINFLQCCSIVVFFFFFGYHLSVCLYTWEDPSNIKRRGWC